jgi:hypothetical protein
MAVYVYVVLSYTRELDYAVVITDTLLLRRPLQVLL